MPRYKLSPEERAAEKERKENLRSIMKGLDVKNFDDLKDVFKMMVGEMLENGLDGELDDELGYTKYDYRNKEGENSTSCMCSLHTDRPSAQPYILFPPPRHCRIPA